MTARSGILLLITLLATWSCQKAEKETVSSGPAAASSLKYVQASGGLRMRETPEVSGKVILTIPDGTPTKILAESGPEIEVSGKTGKWTQVEYAGKTGWVFGGFLGAEPAVPDLAGILMRGDWKTLEHAIGPEAGDAYWHHGLEFQGGGTVKNFCYGECGQHGVGSFRIEGQTIIVEFPPNSNTDFIRGECKYFTINTSRPGACQRALECTHERGKMLLYDQTSAEHMR